LVVGKLRHSCHRECGDALEQGTKALAPAPAQPKAQDYLAPLGTADGAETNSAAMG